MTLLLGILIGYIAIALMLFAFFFYARPEIPIANAILSVMWPITIWMILGLMLMEEYRRSQRRK